MARRGKTNVWGGFNSGSVGWAWAVIVPIWFREADPKTGCASGKPEKTLPCGSDGFRGLLESFELRAMQEFRDVQQNNKTSLEFADASDVSGFAFRKDTARGFDIGGRNLEHFRSRVDDEADQLVVQLDDENAVFLIGKNLGQAKALTEVHHRNDFAAQIDDTLNQIGSAGNGSNLGNPHNFAYGSDTNAVRFIADAKTDDLKVFFHREVSGPLGTRHFGVFNFLRAAGARTTAMAG